MMAILEYFSTQRSLFLCLLVTQGWKWATVDSLRVKQGCYDIAPFSCSDPPRVQEAYDLGVDVERVCKQLELEIFPSEDVAWNPHLHPEHLNSIEAGTDLCNEIQISLSQCLFCSEDEDFATLCIVNANRTKCGDQTTWEEVLQNGRTYQYARFETDADLQATCDELEEVYNTETIYGLGALFSNNLCERQSLVKHLCPGYCNGTCFDAGTFPPTCDPDAYPGVRNESLDSFGVCEEIGSQAFRFADTYTVLNVSKHLEFLRVIPEDAEGATFCHDARQAYSECFWCLDEFCFDEEHPAVCQDSYNATLEVDGIDTEETCRFIYRSIFGLKKPDALPTTPNITDYLFLPGNTTMCNHAREIYSMCYWCADDVPNDFCLGSPCLSNASLPEIFFSGSLSALNITNDDKPELKCDEIYQYFNDTFSDGYYFGLWSRQSCYDHIFLSRICPQQFCREAEVATFNKDYLGATTTAQKRALLWVSRVSAILSFFGASFILLDILRNPKARKTVYHQLLVGMAIFDIITALAWCFATAPIDAAQAEHVEGAMGTSATCTAQAFFIQFGFTSVFYNVSLALYYVLVVAFGWRESQLKKIQLYMQGLPPLVGLGLALGGISTYHWIEYGCHLLPPPEGPLWPVLVFVVLPLGFSIVAITVSMLVVYCKVRRQAASTKKWSFGLSKASALEQAVFWQCLWYVTAFYITWPILFSVYLASVDVTGPLGLTLTVAFVAPLQGFNNFLVYLRPKLKRARSPSRITSSTAGSVFSKVRRAMRSNVSTTLDESRAEMDPSAGLALQRDANHARGYKMDPSAAIAMDRKEEEEGVPNRAPRRLSSVNEGDQSLDSACSESNVTENIALAIGGKEYGKLSKVEADGAFIKENSSKITPREGLSLFELELASPSRLCESDSMGNSYNEPGSNKYPNGDGDSTKGTEGRGVSSNESRSMLDESEGNMDKEFQTLVSKGSDEVVLDNEFGRHRSSFSSDRVGLQVACETPASTDLSDVCESILLGGEEGPPLYPQRPTTSKVVWRSYLLQDPETL